MDIERDKLIEAMEKQYAFPCYYPVVVIARSDEDFYDRLNAALTYEQDGDDFTISKKRSSKKNYTSYRIELYVRSAEDALLRKEFIHALEGVLVMF